MARYGTAPRRISPGVWQTAKGRKLSAAGGAYWENKYRSGATDGRGHITTPSVVQQKPTTAPARQKPPTQPRSYKTPGITPTRATSPRVTRQAAAIRRAHAEGRIS
jgi:hypothetical protein